MRTIWRLITKRFADTAFSGEGARRYGGRWNRKGTPLVYCAGSQSLAILEMLVQDDPLRARYVMIPAFLPIDIEIERLSLEKLPINWRGNTAHPQLQSIGSDWALAQRSAVLVVPSAVVPTESNWLLNPLHPTFCRIQVGVSEEFTTDLRLLRCVKR